MQVSFSDGASTPQLARFKHSTAAYKAFEPLGEIVLQTRPGAHLQHVFRLGADLPVHRFLQITFVGHLQRPASGELTPES